MLWWLQLLSARPRKNKTQNPAGGALVLV